MKFSINVQMGPPIRRILTLLLISLCTSPIALAFQTKMVPEKKKSSAHLRCYVTYADQTEVIDAYPLASGYEAAPIDIGGRFLFKAIMIEKSHRLDHIALYAYFQASPKNLPIHEAIYRGPFRLSRTPALLTPYNHLYAGEVERELKYHCMLSKATS